MIQEERCASMQDDRFGDPRKKFEPVELISTLLEASSVTSGDLIQSLKYPVTCSCNDYGEDLLFHTLASFRCGWGTLVWFRSLVLKIGLVQSKGLLEPSGILSLLFS